MNNAQVLLISNRKEVSFARRNHRKWSCFLPGNHQIEAMMRGFGLRVFSPQEISDEIYTMVQGQVAQTLTSVEPLLPNSDPSLKALLLGQLVRSAHKYFLQKALVEKKSIKVQKLNRSGSPDGFWLVSNLEPTTFMPYSGAVGIPSSDYILDFQSPSGRSSSVLTSKLPVRRVLINDLVAAFGLKKREKGNITLFVRPQGRVQPSSVALRSIIPNSRLASAIGPILEATCEEYLRYRAAFFEAFRDNPPQEAWFNHVKNPRMASAMAALEELGVSTKFQSHGGMHVFGSPAQCEISEALSASYFNSFPAARFIYPRGPLQEPMLRPQQFLAQKNDRLEPYSITLDEYRKGTRFRIAYVPSFIVWQNNFWGLANDCYDTFDVTKCLLNLGAEIEGAEIRVRLRGSLDTHLKGSRRRIITGIDGSSLGPMFKMTDKITDCSGDSYSELLQWADLVITEGITAVTYDALDRRKPVLSLRARDDIRGGFPAEHPSVLMTASRRALYSASIGSFTEADIALLAIHHLGTPLKDNELHDYIYTE